MPPPCAVDRYARLYKRGPPEEECHGLVPWIVTLVSRGCLGVESSVTIHRTRRWHLVLGTALEVEASVKKPRHKAVASWKHDRTRPGHLPRPRLLVPVEHSALDRSAGRGLS